MDKGQCAAHLSRMATFPARSPTEKVGGLVYFGRMLDKIQANDRGELPADWVPNLGKGFDGRCIRFLGLEYQDVVDRVLKGSGNDEEILQWAFERGRKPSDEQVEIWNEFMRKCGWNDELTPMLERRKRESNFEGCDEIQTMFQYIDADEGRA